MELAITIAYDDTRRRALWSNGEEFVTDANGNLVHEVIVYMDVGVDTTIITHDYVIAATEQVCK